MTEPWIRCDVCADVWRKEETIEKGDLIICEKCQELLAEYPGKVYTIIRIDHPFFPKAS